MSSKISFQNGYRVYTTRSDSLIWQANNKLIIAFGLTKVSDSKDLFNNTFILLNIKYLSVHFRYYLIIFVEHKLFDVLQIYSALEMS